MTKLKSEKDFLQQLKNWQNSGNINPQLLSFLQEVYASKLYYEYYDKFIDKNKREEINKLIENPSTKIGILKTSLLSLINDNENLLMRLEDTDQRASYESSIREDEIESLSKDLLFFKRFSKFLFAALFVVIVLFILK